MAVVNISEDTLQKLDQVLNESNFPAKNLRLYTQQGWSGTSFNLALDESTEQDIVEKSGEITFIVDSQLAKTYGGFEIKYINEGHRQGFQIEPQVMPENDGGGCSSCSSCG